MKRLLVLLLIATSAQIVYSQVPTTLSYQGILVDGAGAPVVDGPHSIRFTFYDANSTSSNILYQTGAYNVTTYKGMFTTIIGNSLPTAVANPPISFPAPGGAVSNNIWDNQIWVQVIADATPLTPLIQLTTAPYSFKAQSANSVSATGISGTIPVANGGTNATTASGARTNLGLVIGTDVQALDADLTDLADGSLTGSLVGSGINAANITTGTLAVANGGTGAATAAAARTNLGLGALATLGAVGSTEITDASVTSTDITNGTIAAADLNSMGASNLQVLQFNGASWAPATLPAVAGGTVSSVGLTMPAYFNVTGSPVTTAGTISATIPSQSANTFLAAPGGAPGVPAFRTMVAADVPGLDASKITTGTLPLTMGGTGGTTALAARTSLGLAIGTDVQAFDADLTDLADGSLTGSLVGTGINAANVTSGTLAIANGGTNASTIVAARSNLGLGALATLGAVGSAEITDGSIAATDLNAMGATANQVLQYSGAAWAPVSFSGASTASNGLTIAANNVTLGGTLTANTTLATAGFNLLLTGLGKMAIGATTPQSKLDVGGNMTIGNTYAGVNAGPTNGALVQGNVFIGNTTAPLFSTTPKLLVLNPGGVPGLTEVVRLTGGLNTVGDGPALNFQNGLNNATPTTYPEWISASIACPYKASYQGDLTFYTNDGTVTSGSINTTALERMRITSLGQVGIGTNAPPHLFSISNTADFRTAYIQQSYAGANSQIGMTIDMTSATGTSSKYGIDCNVSGTAASLGTIYGLETDIVPNGTGTAYGVNSSITAVGTGTRYGVYSNVGTSATSTSTAIGVYGSVSGANTGTHYGIYGSASGGSTAYAGYFSGTLYATTLTKGSGSFKIDHPLDPDNKYLSHSFVESPDMMNIYNGNITTDGSGLAIVKLPSYFEALNKDFRYQLTVIRDFAQAIVLEEVQDNHFVIKTSLPNVKVSWQVTGIRHDAYAEQNRIPNEELKSQEEKGKYLNPTAFGKPAEQGIHFRKDPNQ